MSTWIFLRGLTRECRHWGDFPAAFRRELPDAEVLVPDLPGNGRLNALRSPASIEAMAEHCRDALREQGARPPYHLLALSLGAMVAASWMARHPDELRGCVLINTSFAGISPMHRRLRPRNWTTLLGLVLPGRSDAARESAILRMTSALAGDRERIVREWSAWRREHPVSRANALRQLWAAARFRIPDLPPAVSVLVLAGAGDALVDPECSRALARRWQADYAEHPAAGHELTLDDGAWVARQVRAWLERQASAGKSQPPQCGAEAGVSAACAPPAPPAGRR
jgi:pimeloyl-ACP methyl ester carboxylesterase